MQIAATVDDRYTANGKTHTNTDFSRIGKHIGQSLVLHVRASFIRPTFSCVCLCVFVCIADYHFIYHIYSYLFSAISLFTHRLTIYSMQYLLFDLQPLHFPFIVLFNVQIYIFFFDFLCSSRCMCILKQRKRATTTKKKRRHRSTIGKCMHTSHIQHTW